MDVKTAWFMYAFKLLDEIVRKKKSQKKLKKDVYSAIK